MDKLEPPPPFVFEGNLSHGWKTWSKHLDFFLTATESDEKPNKVKTSILLSYIVLYISLSHGLINNK